MITRILAVAAVVAVAATTVVAQGDPIAARQAIMKGNSAQARVAREIMDGKRPFDLAEAKKIFASFEDAAAKFPALFPDNSKTGGDTKVLPVIWEKKSEFNAAIAKFGADAKAVNEKVKDLDSFKAGMSEVGRNCGSCHNAWRQKS